MTHFFDTKDIFRAFFRHKRYFFDTYRYRYRSKAGGASSPRYKAADHTGGGPYTSPGRENSLQTVQNTTKKDIFPPFSTQKIFFLTRTGTGTGPGRGEPRPPGIRPRTTRAQGSRAASKRSKIPSKTLFFTKKSHYYLTTETLTGTGTTPNGWGLPSPAIGRRVTPGGRLERPQGTSPGLFSAKKEPQKEPQKAVSPQKARQKSGKEIFFGQPFWFPRSACVGAFNRAKQLA